MSFQIRHNAGNLDEPPAAEIKTQRTASKVISINGEEFEASNMEDINIHDYATFEHEQHITPKFFSTIRRRTSEDGDPSHKRNLFQEVAREVIRAENVLLAFKHYGHRSDSETENESDDEVFSKDDSNQKETALHWPGMGQLKTIKTDSDSPQNNNDDGKFVTRVHVTPTNDNEVITHPHVTSYPQVTVAPTDPDNSASVKVTLVNGPGTSVEEVPDNSRQGSKKKSAYSRRCCVLQWFTLRVLLAWL